MSASAPAREPRTERGRRTRELLVGAARAVFERQGFAATRMGDIAAEAGVSHGTVYTYFETKEDVLAATIETVVAELMAAIRSVDLADPVERIARANSGYLATVARNAQLLRVVEEVAVTDDRFARILADLRRTHVQRVTAQIERLQGDGDASADTDPRIAAAALCAMVEGFSRHWTQLGSPEDPAGGVTLTLLWQRALGLVGRPEQGQDDDMGKTHLEGSHGIHV